MIISRTGAYISVDIANYEKYYATVGKHGVMYNIHYIWWRFRFGVVGDLNKNRQNKIPCNTVSNSAA